MNGEAKSPQSLTGANVYKASLSQRRGSDGFFKIVNWAEIAKWVGATSARGSPFGIDGSMD
jgi:hypothetical protein